MGFNFFEQDIAIQEKELSISKFELLNSIQIDFNSKILIGPGFSPKLNDLITN
jgi:hypothetical protein